MAYSVPAGVNPTLLNRVAGRFCSVQVWPALVEAYTPPLLEPWKAIASSFWLTGFEAIATTLSAPMPLEMFENVPPLSRLCSTPTEFPPMRIRDELPGPKRMALSESAPLLPTPNCHGPPLTERNTPAVVL